VIGREPELAQLEGFLEVPGAVVISGAPGIGKTTLWEAAADRARDRGLRILCARVSGAESGLAFAALTDLLEDVGTDALDTLPAPQRRGLEVAPPRSRAGSHARRAARDRDRLSQRAPGTRGARARARGDRRRALARPLLGRCARVRRAAAADRGRALSGDPRTGEESALDAVLTDAPRVDVTPLSPARSAASCSSSSGCA
jgi:hypothetical protein